MNRCQRWAFLLSIASLWLASAVASSAQDPCDCSKKPVCGSPTVTCTVTVTPNTNNPCSINSPCTTETIEPVCVYPGTTIDWQAQGATFNVLFTDKTSPIYNGSIEIFQVTSGSSPAGGTVPTGNGSVGCYKYNATFCIAPNQCLITDDPHVVVTCPPNNTNCGVGKKAH